MAVQVDEKDDFFRGLMTIKNNAQGFCVIQEQLKTMRTKDKELKEILSKHPEIVFETEAPDNSILYYLIQSKNVDVLTLSKEEFKKVIPPLSTIRNFRRKIIIDLQKQNIFLENEVKLRKKDIFVKEKYLKDGEAAK